MKPAPEEFAEMLTEAVYRIRLLESKSLQIVQDELGYAIGRQGGSAIEYWRRGKVPGKLSDVEKLARELVKRGNFDSDWMHQFMVVGGYPAASPGVKALCAEPTPDSSTIQSSTLPRRMYRALVGRNRLLKQVMAAINDENGRFLIGLDGLGGIGKTALALDVAKRCEASALFNHVVWFSAAVRQGEIKGKETFTLETVLNGVATQMGLAEVANLPWKEKVQRLRTAMNYKPVLVVLDNLETADEPQDEIISGLRPFLKPSKAILTSRRRFRGDVYTIHLEGLLPKQAIRFIRRDAAEKGIDHVENASDDELKSIVTATGGSPLALKLVASQLMHLPLGVVLHQLRQAVPLTHAPDGGEYLNFYKFIFLHSWSLLDENSKKLLVALACFEPAEGGTFTAIQRTSQLPHVALINSIDHLWHLSLLEMGEVESIRQMRYYLHPLTQYFVLSDIVDVL